MDNEVIEVLSCSTINCYYENNLETDTWRMSDVTYNSSKSSDWSF